MQSSLAASPITFLGITNDALNTYISDACTTESVIQLGDQPIWVSRVLHGTLGLGTEYVEFCDGIDDVNAVEELGDISWYLAVLTDALRHVNGSVEAEINLFCTPVLQYAVLRSVLGELQDVVKRLVYYKENAFAMNKRGVIPIVYLGQLVSSAWFLFGAMCKDRNIEVVATLQANIKKLAKRFPGGAFASEHALYRNIAHELSHIVPAECAVPAVNYPASQFKEEATLSKPTYEEVIADQFNLTSYEAATQATAQIFDEVSARVDAAQFNSLLITWLTSDEIDKLSMLATFKLAAVYRELGAEDIAAGYDAIYRTYSGRGNKLRDNSVFIMWQILGLTLDGARIRTTLREVFNV